MFLFCKLNSYGLIRHSNSIELMRLISNESKRNIIEIEILRLDERGKTRLFSGKTF